MFDVALRHLSTGTWTAKVRVMLPDRASTTEFGLMDTRALRNLPDRNTGENAPAWYTLSGTGATRKLTPATVSAGMSSVAMAAPSLSAAVITAAALEAMECVLGTSLEAKVGTLGQAEAF
jgi:hypothetical protein